MMADYMASQKISGGIRGSAKTDEEYKYGKIDKAEYLTREYKARVENIQAMKDALDIKAETAYTDEDQLSVYQETLALMSQLTEANQAYAASMESFSTAYEVWASQHEAMAQFAEAWGLTQEELYSGTVNLWQDMGSAITDISEQVASSMTQVLTGLIAGTVDVKKAITNLMTSMLSTIIGTFIKIGIQYIITAIIGRSIQAASTAATVASMSAIFAAATPAAIMASIASFGAADVAGMAGFSMAVGGMSAMALGMAGLFSGAGAAEGLGNSVDMFSFADGGMINERVVGRGMSSGNFYEIGEEGPEMVTPMRNRGSRESSIVININGNVLNNYDQLARILVPAIQKANRDGVR
jgi:hypothetical protein